MDSLLGFLLIVLMPIYIPLLYDLSKVIEAVIKAAIIAKDQTFTDLHTDMKMLENWSYSVIREYE